MAALTITQVRSEIGGKQNHRDTLRSLGLRKIGQSVVREDSAVVLGMVRAVRHLVVVEVAPAGAPSGTASSTEEVR